ncbi:reversion-inducing cysteine-rich protein with Kazal motifs isoform X2 [Chelonus insularis]|nr:reversion-inducing cysteine-rich protein with Kazal motifs isoform X2 [Chelonus insularis]
MSCCSLVTGSCRNTCNQVSFAALKLTDYQAKKNLNQRLTQSCPFELIEFWSCINSTQNEATDHENWIGKNCCHLAQYPICQSTCMLAGSKTHLESSCRSSDELEFYFCLEKQEEIERCCSSITNGTCRASCREIFHKSEQQSSLKLYSSKGCFHQIPKCLESISESFTASDNPRQYLNCCKEATTSTCLDACRKILFTATSVKDILDTLEAKCQPAQPHSPLWSCFLQQSSSMKPTRLPLDIGKLNCCSRASSTNCQILCWRAFQADWEVAWTQLETDCLSLSSEGELRRCLEDADEPCEMGCSGLSYCTKFNNQPTSLFRSCSKIADDSAKWEADHWARGGIIRGLGVPVRADPSCPVESLKAAACLLQLRPCETRVHETQLCRDDCLELMVNCVDWTAITRSTTAASLCSKLSPPRPDMPCISLKPFLTDQSQLELNSFITQDNIITPCKNNPCPDDHMCVPQPNSDIYYQCIPSCTLGEMSRLTVPINTWVQIPRTDQQQQNSGCHRICRCSLNGFEKCKTLNCFSLNSCWVQDRFVAHRTNFYLDCNSCHCFEGEVSCSRKICGREIRQPTLPCDCPAHYVPVCSRFGVTYPSACLAKCAGLGVNDIVFGRCSSIDPCRPNPCGTAEKCLRKPRVCLSNIHKPCKQYECIPMDCEHDSKITPVEPVCDRDNRQYNSTCALVKSGATLAYRGPCLKGCSLREPVCGVNGEVYPSECSAWAHNTVVDYNGPCMAVGLIGDGNIPRCSDTLIKCPKLNLPNCIGVTPPGACCPVCGGAARIFFSKKQLDRIYYIMEEEIDKDSVTLESLLKGLQRQIQVLQCSIRGHVTPENDIFIIVQPTIKKPSALLFQACIAETEKIITRIIERSSKIIAEVPLGSLTRAEIVHGHVSSSISLWYFSNFTILIFFSFVFSFVFNR